MFWVSGSNRTKAPRSGPRCAPIWPTGASATCWWVCCDGLTGFPEAIAATWSHAAVQTCVVHLIRNAMRFVSYGERKAVAAAIKPVYTAANAEAARRVGRLRRLGLGRRTLRDQGFRPVLGTVHPRFGVPPRAAASDLHDQLHRVAELPDAQGHQEPRPVPQRRRRSETALAGDLQHRRQTRRRTSQRTRPETLPNSPGRLVEGQVVTNWKKALEQLMLVYPDRIEPYL